MNPSQLTGGGPNERSTCHEMLLENARVRGNAPAVIAGECQRSHSELLEKASWVAAGLRERGIQQGDRVGILLSNRIEWLDLCFGIFLAGATVVPLSTWSTPAELTFLVADSRIRLLFAQAGFGDRDFLSDLHEIARGGTPVVMVDHASRLPNEELESLDEFAALDPGFVPGASAAQPDSDAFVLYTSGSTSYPKGVRLRHCDLAANSANIGERQGLCADDRVFVSVPLFWAYGSANAMLAAFSCGAALVLADKFEAGSALDIIERQACTAIYTLPAMTAALVNHAAFDPSRTRTLRTGLTIGTPEEFLLAVERLGVEQLCNVYGATETCGNCAVTWHHWPADRRASTQGPLLPGQELRIRHPESGEIIDSQTTGLMEVRGHIAAGYTGKSESFNSEAFTDDGFYRTGDLGRLDASGAVQFMGRATDMIKRAGINVSPAEVEAVLLRQAGVDAAVVVGAEDPRRGEAIVAFVVSGPDSAVSTAQLLDALRLELSKYKIPDWIERVASLPLTPTGKLHRSQIRKEALQLVRQHLSRAS